MLFLKLNRAQSLFTILTINPVVKCQDPSDHRLYPYGKLTLARQVLNSLLTGSELTS